VAEVELGASGLVALGTQVAVDPAPYRLDYRLEAGGDLVTRTLSVESRGTGWRRRLELRADGRGSWDVEAEARGDGPFEAGPGGEMAELEGALDCDLGLSPLTNLMPIRRSGLDRGPGAADFLMAWVSVPDLRVVGSAQRYEHLRAGADGSSVRYVDRGLFDGFTADLVLDPSGLVITYPGLAERVG
jgi:hypothetical protein